MFHTQTHTSFPHSDDTSEVSERPSHAHPDIPMWSAEPAQTSQHRAAAVPKVTIASTPLAVESSTGRPSLLLSERDPPCTPHPCRINHIQHLTLDQIPLPELFPKPPTGCDPFVTEERFWAPSRIERQQVDNSHTWISSVYTCCPPSPRFSYGLPHWRLQKFPVPV